jgi:hypothetical protein
MTGAREKIFDGSLLWIEDEDVGVVRERRVSEREWVCQARCATEGARLAVTEGARRIKAGLVSSELLAHADDPASAGHNAGK